MQSKLINAPEVILAAKEKAFSAGYAAAEENRRRSPILCKTYRSVVADLVTGVDDSLELVFQSWLDGYQAQLDELTAEIKAIPVLIQPDRDGL